jgi:mannose-1-phosphate guanylyltransferase
MTRIPTTAKFIGRKQRATAQAAPLCGLVLAGGEGQRLRSFVKRLRGDALPKQYVNFSGSHSMLEHTYIRAEKLISRERLFTVVNRAHLNFPEVNEQLCDREPGTVVVQPANRETGPGLLLPLTYLYKRYPDATVAVFPSDQFILEADHLMRHIRLARAVVERRPSNLVLLGVTPDYEESDYGYILPTSARDTTGWGIRRVQTFIEKPDILRAHDLIGQGALWNTMLMVFNAAALLRRVSELHPDIYDYFARIYDAIGTDAEADMVQAAYRQLPTVNFSKELLEPLVEKHPGTVTVLPVTNLTWSDWGTESRVVGSLRKLSEVTCRMQRISAVQKSSRVSSKRRDPDHPAALTT